MASFVFVMKLKQNCLFDLANLIEYWTSALNLVSSNPWVGPLSRIKMSFFCY